MSITSINTNARTVRTVKDDRLLKACRDFEAVFLSMMWKEMQKSVGTDLGGYGAFAEQAMGEALSKAGGLGLAKVIYQNISNHPLQ